MSVGICWDMDRVAGGMFSSGLVLSKKTVSGAFRRSRTVCGDPAGAAGSAGSTDAGAESDVEPDSEPDLELDSEPDSEPDSESDLE